MLVFVEQEIPHYRVGTLNALNQALDGRLVVYSGKCPPDSNLIEGDPQDMAFQHKYLKSKWLLNNKILWMNYFKVLEKDKIDALIIRDSVRSILLLPFIIYCRSKKIPILLWGQGFSRKRIFNPSNNPIDVLHLFKNYLCSAYIVYSAGTKKTLSKWVSTDKLFVANNTINIESQNSHYDKQFSNPKSSTIVFIGRLQKRKKVHLLLQAVDFLQKNGYEALRVVIIGDGDEQNELKKLSIQKDIQNIKWRGQLSFAQAEEDLKLADLVVIPGWLGLAINHAFSYGLPVITESPNDNCTNHPPEIEYFKNGFNGLYYEPENAESLANAIIEVIKNESFFSRGALQTFNEDMSLEAMINGFVSAISYACDK
jgi:glycosyltransferase involved in cell wall biosynthesis